LFISLEELFFKSEIHTFDEKMKYGLLLALISIALIDCYETGFQQQTLLNRLIRAANANKKQECRYEKEPWEECDLTTGQQKRVLKLKTSRSVPTHCEPEKFIQRPCKKHCRYSKGIWSECINGLKSRLDSLKTDPSSTFGCEATRNVTKTCKEACHYEKSDWSQCDNGVKIKTFTLMNGKNSGSNCEPTKVIRKQCGKDNPNRRARKQNRNKAQTDS